jgi:hypothetical protein
MSDAVSPHFEHDLVDLAGESCVRADADALGHRRLVVQADVGRFKWLSFQF